MASLASTNQNPSSDSPEKQQECFQNFFQCWIHEQDSYLHQLISVSKSHKSEQGEDDDDVDREDDERVFKPLLNQVLQHYETYYRIKSVCVKKDVLSMLAPSWRSSLEEAFIWIGGWRPSMAFHLLYSKSGLQLQARLHDIVRGLTTGDLADLSASQLVMVDELQRTTLREEKELTEKLAKQQETVADSSMVELSEVVTELMMSHDERANETLNSGGGGEDVGERVESTLKSKEDGLEKIMERADDLRLKTLKGVIEILSPIQAVYFLIAAAELHIRLHDWGMKKDANNHHQHQHQHQHQHGIGIHHSQQDHYGGSSTGTVPAVAVAAAAAGGGGGGEGTSSSI